MVGRFGSTWLCKYAFIRACDDGVWNDISRVESQFDSWLAVVQDIWGTDCFGPAQQEMAHQGALGVTITKAKIIGAIGAALGGLGPVAAESSSYIEVFEGDAGVLRYKQEPRPASPGHKYLRLAPMNPAQIDLKSGRYHGLMSFGTFALSGDFEATANSLAQSVRPGGYLYVDELFAADPSVALLVGQGIGCHGETAHLHPHQAVASALTTATLQLRSQSTASASLMASLRDGLDRSQAIALVLKTLPEPFRKQRMMAYVDELKRAAVLYQSLERGLVTAVRCVYSKPNTRIS